MMMVMSVTAVRWSYGRVASVVVFLLVMTRDLGNIVPQTKQFSDRHDGGNYDKKGMQGEDDTGYNRSYTADGVDDVVRYYGHS